MGNYEGEPNTRWSLSKFLMVGLIIAGIGYLPIQLYILFGPRDGNPVGLGLLFVIGIFAGLTVFVIGILKHALQYLMNRRR